MATNAIKITRQDISLTVDNLTQKISGCTELFIEKTTEYTPGAIFLNARQMTINSVIINDQETPFEYIDTHSAFNLAASKPLVRDASHFARISYDVLTSPELVVPLPKIDDKTPINFPIKMKVHYQLNDDNSSIVKKEGLLYTDNRLDGPSAWFPCIDSLGQRSVFTLYITYHKEMVCAGFGKDSLTATDDSLGTNTMRFHNPFPLQPKAIGFAIGDFQVQQPSLPDGTSVTYFIPSEDEVFRHTMNPVPEIILDVKDLFLDDSDDFDVSIVYIPYVHEIHSFAGLIFYPSDLLVPDGNVNVYITIVPKIIEMLIGQLIYFLFPMSNTADEWIQTGLIKYFADVIGVKKYKKSFAMERRWNDMNYVFKEDIHPHVVLSATDPATLQPFRDEYLMVKAKLLMNMISTSMSASGAQSMLTDLIRQLLKQSMEGVDISNKFYSTISPFCSLIDFKTFKRQWLNGNGMPIFTFNFTVDQRNKMMRFVLYQTPSCTTTSTKLYTGHLLIQLRDLEQPHEFKFPVESQLIYQQLKYFAPKPKAKHRTYTFVSNEKQEIGVHSAVMWVTLDPQHNWLLKVRPRMPQFMVHNQLLLVREVFAQHQALSSLEEWGRTSATQELLAQFLENPKVFYGVRGHVARVLATYADDDNTHAQKLMAWYRTEFFVQDKPKNHNFQNLSLHFVQLAVISAMSTVRMNNDYTPEDIVKLIHIIHEQSENSSNQYSDDFFQAECALALGRMRPESAQLMQSSEDQLLQRVRGLQSDAGFQGILVSSRYIGITALILKNCEHRRAVSEEYIKGHAMTITNMREIVLGEGHMLQCKAAVFRCLLFLALVNFGVGFEELISDVHRLCIDGMREDAAVCLRELYRFLQNTLPYGEKDRAEGQLLCLPPGMTRDEQRHAVTDGPHALEIAETLWTILTEHAMYHAVLRSEALRAYTALYGRDTPKCYLERGTSLGFDIVPTNSGRTILCIEKRNRLPPVPKKETQPAQPQITIP